MRLLLDESLPSRLRRSLPGHSVKTVVEIGWGGVKNLATLPLSVIVLSAHSNELPHLLPLIPLLEEALATLQPCTYASIALG